jgi:glycosyltransferase involved in cell wall biosynthesis
MSPKVSVIVPCYNEQSTILSMLKAFHAQTFPRAEMEVVIADGSSTDGTRAEIASFQKDFPDLPVRLVENTNAGRLLFVSTDIPSLTLTMSPTALPRTKRAWDQTLAACGRSVRALTHGSRTPSPRRPRIRSG